jgi:PAS domain S-box-containing protein
MPTDPRRRGDAAHAERARPEQQLDAARRRIEACETALEESEARFRNIIDNNGDAIVVVGNDGIVKYANEAAGRMFGRPPSRLRGTEFGFPLTAGETTEIDVIARGGEVRPAEMRVTDSTWDGMPVCLASLRDLTDRELLRRERGAQLAASMAEARLRDIISQAPVAIAVLGGPEHRFDIANERYLELIGGRQVLGRTIREALPEFAGQGIYEVLDTVYASGEPFIGTEVDLMVVREHGPEQAFFNFVYQPLREANGRNSGIAVVASDVTAQVRARRAVEQANKAKSDFLATMSHELRTPLNAIGGYADLILAGIRGPITPAQELDLERIKRSQRHLLAVINDILNFAKLESGRIQFHPVTISMNAVLGELESLVTPILMQKGIAYEFRCCDPKYEAYADPERVQQILLNLLSNAAKFTGANGRITVECVPGKTTMVVNVMDTGSGIPADKLQTIFEPFVQLERGQAPEMGGTGLGLSISRDLARAMGGDLSATSEPQKGSTFRLVLPRAKTED